MYGGVCILMLPKISMPAKYLIVFFFCYIIYRGICYVVSHGITVTSDRVQCFLFGVMFPDIG